VAQHPGQQFGPSYVIPVQRRHDHSMAGSTSRIDQPSRNSVGYR
jgi:hypothetical protein